MDSNSEQPYVFLPEPGKPAPPPPRRPVPAVDRRPNPWSWLLLGVPLGILGTILVQQALWPKPRKAAFLPVPSPSASATQSPLPSPSPTPLVQPTAIPTPPEADPLAQLNFVPAILGGPPGVDGAPGMPGPGMGPVPMSGGLGFRGPMPPLPDVLGNPGNQPLHPTVEGTVPAAGPPVDVTLVTFAFQTGENQVDGTVSRLSAVASKFGGTSSPFVEMAEKKEGDKNAVLVIVPADKKESAVAAIKALGATKDEDWNGTSQERQLLLEERLLMSLHDLQREKEKLLIKYYDDAGPVKDIDDRIDTAQRQLRSVRVGRAAKNAIIRVYVGPNA